MTSQISASGAVPLPHWGVIRAQGADAASFLHGQLTNDFNGLGLGHARLAGFCSVKGRLIASFVGWREAPDDILLVCSADLLAATLKRLSMFVLRAKCKLSDASGSVRLAGLVGNAASLGLGDQAPAEAWGRSHSAGVTLIRLPDAAGQQRYLWAGIATNGDDPPPLPDLPPVSVDDWRWLEVQSGIAMISAATSEKFVPQMINFEVVGGVNFQKGCYPGQEIVARAQYRGTVKRRAFLFDSDGTGAAGQEVFSGNDPGQPSGTVALSAPAPGGGSSSLIEVQLVTLDEPLRLGSIDGPLLKRAALPYRLPGESDLQE